MSHFPLAALNISAPYSTLSSAERQHFLLDQVCQLVRFDNIKVWRGGSSRSVPLVTANAFLYVFFNARQHCRSKGSMGRKRQCCKLDYAPFIFIPCPDLQCYFCLFNSSKIVFKERVQPWCTICLAGSLSPHPPYGSPHLSLSPLVCNPSPQTPINSELMGCRSQAEKSSD